jgi:hypothetical protein
VNAQVRVDVFLALVEDVLALNLRAAVGADEVADRAHRAALVDDERALADPEGQLRPDAGQVETFELVVVAIEDVDAGRSTSRDAELVVVPAVSETSLVAGRRDDGCLGIARSDP